MSSTKVQHFLRLSNTAYGDPANDARLPINLKDSIPGPGGGPPGKPSFHHASTNPNTYYNRAQLKRYPTSSQMNFLAAFHTACITTQNKMMTTQVLQIFLFILRTTN